MDSAPVVASKPNDTDSERAKKLMIARDAAMAELDKLVGIASVKAQVGALCETAIQNERRRTLVGIMPQASCNHMLFLGNPGTGKSTVAGIVARLLHKIGVAPTDKLSVFESARTALVSGIQNQTAGLAERVFHDAMCTGLRWEDVGAAAPTDEDPERDPLCLKHKPLISSLERNRDRSETIVKIPRREWVEFNIKLRSDHYVKGKNTYYKPVRQGGVLMLDEAYELIPMQGCSDFSQEAIGVLNSHSDLLREQLIIILAGYWEKPNGRDIKRLLAQNSGLDSRFPHRIHFPDYQPDELLEIASRMVAAKQFRLDDGAVAALRSKFTHPLPSNARGVRVIIEKATSKLDSRMGAIPCPTREDLTTLTAADFA